MIQEVVCRLDEVKEGQLKEVSVGSGKVLVTNIHGQISAVSAKCTHYGAPLIGGAYSDGKVRCPWHGACFDLQTGDIEDFPGLDCLHKFQVEVKNGDVIVTASEEALSDFRRVKEMCTSLNSPKTFAIIGGGVSSLICAETLRQEGFAGKLVLATKEGHPPYDRTKLSKTLNAKPDTLYLRTEQFLKDHNIDLQMNKQAVSVDSLKKTVKFSDGTHLSYDKLYIATGGTPRLLTIPGATLANVLYLRTPDDALRIHDLAQNKDVVLLGTGFIGMEIAAYLVGKAKSVAVVGSGQFKIPFESLLGREVGDMFLKLHKDKGVKFYLDYPAVQIRGENGKVIDVVLKDGSSVPADLVIVGIGVRASTDFLADTANVRLDERGNVLVDKYLCAGSDIYAGGDIVSYPNLHLDDEMINIGHWQLASAHGRCAALNMLGRSKPIATVPFFWTLMFGKGLRYAGHASRIDEIIIEGSVADFKFGAYYIQDGKVVAYACMNMAAKASEMAFLIEHGRAPSAEQVRKSMAT